MTEYRLTSGPPVDLDVEAAFGSLAVVFASWVALTWLPFGVFGQLGRTIRRFC